MRYTFLFAICLISALAAQMPAPVPVDVEEEAPLSEAAGRTVHAEAQPDVAALTDADQPAGQLVTEDAQGRTVLSWGPQVADNHSWYEYYPLATTFTAPFDCRLVAYRFLWSGYAAMYSAEGQAPAPLLDVTLYADSRDGAQRPVGEPRFTLTVDLSWATAEWIEVDVSGWGVTFEGGEVFHPGWSSNTELASALSYHLVSGSCSCWYTLNSTEQPMWMDAHQDWTHVVEAVVEKL
jgi:hypothetical protein